MKNSDVLLSGFRAALGRVAVGVVLLNREGYCTFLNGHAEALMDKRHGVHVVEGRLQSLQVHDDSLEQLVEETLADPRRNAGCLLVRDSRGRPMLVVSLHATRADREGEPNDICAIAFLREVTPQVPGVEPWLADLFQLSIAEASLAWALFETGDLAEACRRLRKALPTGRTQLRSILAKTCCRRQSELFRMIAAATSIVAVVPVES